MTCKPLRVAVVKPYFYSEKTFDPVHSFGHVKEQFTWHSNCDVHELISIKYMIEKSFIIFKSSFVL